MIREGASGKRELKTISLSADLVVVGGGLSGVCCAITAARAGIKVLLVQDRPVLGGNSSSEVRLWVLGATSHMGNNNRWAREGGVIDELLTENMYRNREGNAVIFDTVVLEKVMNEKNIQLLLNTAVYEVTKKEEDAIKSIKAFCSQNSTQYELSAPLFCDASGDGIVAFQAGGAFRMGAESREEFGEKFAPSSEYGELLGHSIYFYTKDTGKPVKYVAPAYALDDITKIPRYRKFNTKDQGCNLWWIEYGGRLDTVHDTEKIKWELWKVVYGVWNYIKNAGHFPEAETLTLEWVGTIPGKRESRRFEGDYMLKQQDIVEQKEHEDAVAFGGWSIDLHPADGVFSEKPGCNQWHSKGVYQIPYRCLYSRNLSNLFLAGRIISASHVAYGSSRVMATAACVGQAVGMAAAMCAKENLNIRQLNEVPKMKRLQRQLLKAGHYIPGVKLEDRSDIVKEATVSVSSEMKLKEFPENGEWFVLKNSSAQMLPLKAGQPISISCKVVAMADTRLSVEFRASSKSGNHTPDVLIEKNDIALKKGENQITIAFTRGLHKDGYGFICFMKNENVELMTSLSRVSGILSVFNKTNPSVSNYGNQEPEEDIGIDAFEFWCPDRRPAGKNIAMQIEPPIQLFGAANLINGVDRPVSAPNAWVAAFQDRKPVVTVAWNSVKTIASLQVCADNDFDHPMETVLMGHPENVMPFCISFLQISDDEQKVVHTVTDNHQGVITITFDKPIVTRSLSFHAKSSDKNIPASLFAIRAYEPVPLL